MKKIITFALAIMITSAAVAGNNNKLPFISMGVKFGISTESTKLKVDGLGWTLNMPSDKFTGYHAGAVFRLELPVIPIYIQPELVYNWGKIKESTWKDIKLSTFNVPVLLGFGVGSSNLLQIRSNLVPLFNLVSESKIGEISIGGIADAFRKPTVTWTAGLGIDIIGITFDVRYNGQFKKNETTLQITGLQDATGISASERHQSWTFSLGYLF